MDRILSISGTEVLPGFRGERTPACLLGESGAGLNAESLSCWRKAVVVIGGVGVGVGVGVDVVSWFGRQWMWEEEEGRLT